MQEGPAAGSTPATFELTIAPFLHATLRLQSAGGLGACCQT